jgi:GT2 family glycosyltransferase
MTPREVSAVVVSFGHRASLPTALASLARIGPGLLEVVVVDNAGDLGDGLVSRCSPVPPSVLFPASNLGYAAAANLAVGRTHGELLLFLSPDAEILDFRRQQVDESLGPTVGAVGALTLDALDRPSVSWGEFPGVSRVLRRVSGGRARFNRRVLDAAACGHTVAVPWVVGAAVLLRRETFDRLGGYDPFYAAAGEDQDLGRRLELDGLGSVVSSSWRVRHEPRAAETLKRVIRRNEIRFLERHGSRLDRLLWTLAYRTRR